MIFTAALYILALMGLYMLTRVLIIPFGDAALFATGKLLFNWWVWYENRKTNNLLVFIKPTIQIFLYEFLDRLTCIGTVTESTWGKYEWKPYFHYKRR